MHHRTSISLVLTFIFLATPLVQAQLSQEEVAMMQNLFGMEKRGIYTKVMKLSAADSVSFWPLYDEYEVKRKDLGKQRIDLTKAFVAKYPNISHDEINDLIEDIDDVNEDLNELIKDYYDNIRKKTSAQTAAMFYQMEQYIKQATFVSMYHDLPMLGEFRLGIKKD